MLLRAARHCKLVGRMNAQRTHRAARDKVRQQRRKQHVGLRNTIIVPMLVSINVSIFVIVVIVCIIGRANGAKRNTAVGAARDESRRG